MLRPASRIGETRCRRSVSALKVVHTARRKPRISSVSVRSGPGQGHGTLDLLPWTISEAYPPDVARLHGDVLLSIHFRTGVLIVLAVLWLSEALAVRCACIAGAQLSVAAIWRRALIVYKRLFNIAFISWASVWTAVLRSCQLVRFPEGLTDLHRLAAGNSHRQACTRVTWPSWWWQDCAKVSPACGRQQGLCHRY